MTEYVKFLVYRYRPEDGKKGVYADYDVPVKKGMTVLDGLIYIKENLDPTLSVRFSCRMAICGSCGMRVNGLEMLACHTQILGLRRKHIIVEPMRNFPLLRDLVTDMTPLFMKQKALKTWLIRRDELEQENPTIQYLQSEEELGKYLQFTYCIQCGLCYSACPVVSTFPAFLGPQSLMKVYRYFADSRDEVGRERVSFVDKFEGVWRCHFAGSCSAVCPKGVDPALAIQLLRREALK
ncbi:MAG: succinate dehydrogenase iron-sulfur subunit [Nitrososphaerota archaeon]|nr:succinate dehydrogenase iron-sulfur subunit [Candidatus Calditenuaceae archaeon]MDW8072957.1 succinate dehydrogenase iron-sulfur subunit [Nitrososphaerota archaeon]